MKKMLCVLIALFCVLPCFNLGAVAAAGGEAGEIRVPITLNVPTAIAGAEFEFSCTSGLTFISFEKSETIQAASITPVVEKNGKIYFGFYHGSNDFEPVNGVLDVGYLIFDYSGEPNQSITVTEAKFVEVVDKQTTNSQILVINDEIDVPLASGAMLQVGKKSYTLWIILACAVVVIAIVSVIIYKKKSKNKKPAVVAADVNNSNQ